MKWSELPKEYQDLEKKFSSICYYENDTESNCIAERFRWEDTPQEYAFWVKCYWAKTITDLPKIEVTTYYNIKQPEKKERYFIVFWIKAIQNGFTVGNNLTVTDGKYFNTNIWAQDYPDAIITNIIELSESDYNDFIA